MDGHSTNNAKGSKELLRASISAAPQYQQMITQKAMKARLKLAWTAINCTRQVST
jgi:hypothetical protein